MKILLRLPNWLGDMVMATGAVQQLPLFFPGAEVSVIVKQGLHDLLDFFPLFQRRWVFDKNEYSGPKGLWRFGKEIRKVERFDLFISFPDSFSSALMGFATGAAQRIGYKNEARNVLLSHAYAKPVGLHRVEEYVRLLELFAAKKAEAVEVSLRHSFGKQDFLALNINSEAQSRRLTTAKAVEIIKAVRKEFNQRIVLIGGPKEKDFVEGVLRKADDRQGIESVAGKTSLNELVQVLASAKLLLTTDSGPAHLANALGTKTVVLFGAGNENNTSPYNKQNGQTIRLGKLSCEPCTKNICVQFETPQCLELLETKIILSAMKEKLN